MNGGQTPYHPHTNDIPASPTSEHVTGGPDGSTDHPEDVKSTPCQPLGAACDAQQSETPCGERSAALSAGDSEVENPSPIGPPRLPDPAEREQPSSLKFPVPKNRDRPPLSPVAAVIIVNDGIVVKQVPRYGRPEPFTKEVTKISPSNRDLLERIKQKGQLPRWDPEEDLPCAEIDAPVGPEDVTLIFDLDDMLGAEWMGRDCGPLVDADNPSIQAPHQAAQKLDAARKRAARFNEFGRNVTGQAMSWIKEIEGNDKEPATWRIPGIFYRGF